MFISTKKPISTLIYFYSSDPVCERKAMYMFVPFGLVMCMLVGEG